MRTVSWTESTEAAKKTKQKGRGKREEWTATTNEKLQFTLFFH